MKALKRKGPRRDDKKLSIGNPSKTPERTNFINISHAVMRYAATRGGIKFQEGYGLII